MSSVIYLYPFLLIKNEDIEEPIFDLRDRKRIFKRSYIDERTLDIDLYKRQSAVIG